MRLSGLIALLFCCLKLSAQNKIRISADDIITIINKENIITDSFPAVLTIGADLSIGDRQKLIDFCIQSGIPSLWINKEEIASPGLIAMPLDSEVYQLSIGADDSVVYLEKSTILKMSAEPVMAAGPPELYVIYGRDKKTGKFIEKPGSREVIPYTDTLPHIQKQLKTN